jgi:small subunit ribosomal protein S7
MGRKPVKKRPQVAPDPKFGSVLVARLVGHVLRRGKRSLAERIVYGAFERISEKTKQDPLDIFGRAVENVTPALEVISRRIGGATYQIAKEVPQRRGETLALRWLVEAARSRKGAPMVEKLAHEIMAAAKKEGAAYKKREDVHRMAEASRAFAHYA